LKIKEPTGSLCWALARQTVGGGTLVGDTVNDNSETYLAAQAFSGTYEVRVERVWGHTLNNKATVTVIRHQGTPDEAQQRFTVARPTSRPLTVKLDGGRRTELAYGPPQKPVDLTARTAEAAEQGADRVLNQLRALADPEVTGTSQGPRGAAYAGGFEQPK